MPYKKKANPGTVQFNKLIAELPEQREKVQAQVQFRHDLLESQKRVNYKNKYDEMVLLSGIVSLSSVALSFLFLCWHPIQAIF